MRRSLIVLLTVLLVLVTVWGGSRLLSSPEPQEGDEPSIPPEVWENQDRLIEARAMLRSAGLAGLGIPLAGTYVDAWTCTLHVGLTEIAEKYTAPIEAIVEQVEGVNLEFFEARFTEPELARLKAQVEGSFLRSCSPAEQGVPLAFVGVDIKGNGLVIGFTEIRPEYVAAIREVIGDEVPIEFLEGQLDLQRTGKHRPMLGGIKLSTDLGASTLSFPATVSGGLGFVMTGHAGEVGDQVWQPTRWLWNRVGTISADPLGSRYSDAAFVPNTNIDPLVWPDRNIVGWSASYETGVGETVNMEGIATDGTSGIIAWPYINFVVDYTYYLYGQMLATYESAGGDSGAPVFRTDAQGNAIILGTHWASWGDYAVYSPVEGIAWDLGLDGITLQGVTGLVGDSYSGWPLQGAEVWVHETGQVAFSDAARRYRILLGPGTYALTASYPTFYEETRTAQVVSGQFATLHFNLDPIYPGCPIPLDTGELPGVTAAPH
jgi:hypothetical protein